MIQQLQAKQIYYQSEYDEQIIALKCMYWSTQPSTTDHALVTNINASENKDFATVPNFMCYELLMHLFPCLCEPLEDYISLTRVSLLLKFTSCGFNLHFHTLCPILPQMWHCPGNLVVYCCYYWLFW